MTGLKKQIKQKELAIIANKIDLHNQMEEIKFIAKTRMSSPIGLTSAFFVGFLFVYCIKSKKYGKKPLPDYLAVLNRLVAHISLGLSIRRLFSGL